MPKTRKTVPNPFHRRLKDAPATQEMLQLFRKEVRADIRSLKSGTEGRFKGMDARFNDVDAQFKKVDARFKEIDARFDKVDARFKEVDARFDKVDARFKEVDARFDRVDEQLKSMDSKIDRVLAEVSRIGLVVEEQNSKNQLAMEAMTGLFSRQDRVETRMDQVENQTKYLITSRSDQ